ncbi:helix-turn-helix transcriptional regulator [Microbacterium sp. NPDC087589]|uniref:helix-turn-helix transcriptional regulator n=1 Tax=Microbacterium sp. NPDC087589 TaxID=3364191 RepID=UPI0038256E2E
MAPEANYLTPQQVCDLIPGMTVGGLAQLRFKGTGPTYLKPTARKVLYRPADITDWLDGTARTWTGEARAA